MLTVSTAFLDVELFLILFFPSKEVVVLTLDGVAGPSTRETSLVTTCEANTSTSFASSLHILPFSNFEDSCVMDFVEGVDSNDDLSFDGHIPFICSLGVPLFTF